MSDLSNAARSIIDEYLEDEKVLALTLAVMYWGSVGTNPKSTPPAEGKIVLTAQVFHRYLMS